MSSVLTTKLCLWNRCPCADPFQTDKALFEHLRSAHSDGYRLAADFPFVCQWAGCAYSTSEPRARTLHVISHTDYRPWVCTQADCGRAYTCRKALYNHRRDSGHARFVNEERRCDWAGCGIPLTAIPDVSDHMERHAAGVARGMRCEWAGCGYVFPGTAHLKHVWSHLPDRPKPFARPVFLCHCRPASLADLGRVSEQHCDQRFLSAKETAKHARVTHPMPEPSRATSSESDYDDDYAPAPTRKRAVSPPPQKVMLKLKRSRLKPHSPDESESELDIVLNTPPTSSVKLECEEQGVGYDAEIAVAVQRIVDSPAWALPARRPAAKRARKRDARPELVLQKLAVDDETDWVYCT